MSFGRRRRTESNSFGRSGRDRSGASPSWTGGPTAGRRHGRWVEAGGWAKRAVAHRRATVARWRHSRPARPRRDVAGIANGVAWMTWMLGADPPDGAFAQIAANWSACRRWHNVRSEGARGRGCEASDPRKAVFGEAGHDVIIRERIADPIVGEKETNCRGLRKTGARRGLCVIRLRSRSRDCRASAKHLRDLATARDGAHEKVLCQSSAPPTAQSVDKIGAA